MEEERESSDVPQALSALLFLVLILGLWFYLDTLRIG
jgi:hypothetical protein